MTLSERIAAFSKLGQFLGQFSENTAKSPNDLSVKLEAEISSAVHYNGWFKKNHVRFALNQWHQALTKDTLETWLKLYHIKDDISKTVGLILAGNIPLVGFHDVLSVLITGHKVLIKQSSNDQRLLPVLLDYLIKVEPKFKDRISFAEGKLSGYDAIIATGSNNTARYFDYYFKDVPNIIRKNRSSAAILNGEETDEQLQNLSNDIFRYYGMGCRSVSKLFVPKDYDFDRFFKNIYQWKDIINDHKYANNYDYNKAVYLMSGADMLDNNYLLVKQDEGFSSPIGVLFYEEYTSENLLKERLDKQKDNLQCIVSEGSIKKSTSFGETQHPKLLDYADDIDTVDFLLKLG